MRRLEPGEEIDDLLAPYASFDRRPGAGDCWLMANMVGGLDGTAAVGGRVGVLSAGVDAELFQLMRALADVVLVGAETVRRERYGPVRLAPDRQKTRLGLGKPAVPPIAVMSRSLRLDWDAPLFTDAAPDARTIIVTCERDHRAERDREPGSAAAGSGPADAEPAVPEGTDPANGTPERFAHAAKAGEVIVAGDDYVDLALALSALHRHGARVVLCEGGPTLLGEIVALDLLDELCLTIAPVMGGDPLPISISPIGATPRRFELATTLAHGNTLFLRYLRSGA